MEGKEAIIAKITENARLTADNIVRDAESERDAAVNAAKASAEKEAELKKAALSEECDRIVARKITLAGLEARKLILFEKQAVLSAAYEKAQQGLLKDEKRYAELMARLVENSAEQGDVLCVGEEDKSVLDGKWFSELAKKLSVKITLGKDTHKGRGVILKGNLSDKDLTVASVMRELRDRTESRAAEILFGDTDGSRQ